MRYMIDTYGNVDLGTLAWSKDGLNFYTDGISNKIKKPKDNDTVANIYCNLYRAVALNASFVEGDMAVKSTSGYLYIRNTRYTTTAEFKEAMRGQILRYELETPANGGYLPMYKGRYKISDVCQLLDKSTYPATQTINGITFTNNGDGSYTANGTVSGDYAVLYVAQVSNLIVGHKYYSPSSENVPAVYIETKIDRKNADTIWVSNQIREWKENDTVMYITLIVLRGANTVENAMLFPQLFDLTEMFGAGNEPTTVAEFKEKFPDDLYPYSPYCWAKIKQMRYVTTTKNLFGYSSINIANDMANGTIIESLPNGAIVQGDAGADPGSSSYSSGWFRPGYSSNSPVIKSYLLAGDTVTVSCDYLILERSYSTLTTVGIYLYDSTHGLTDVTVYDLEVGKLYRLTATYTVDAEGDYFPTFTINSNKTKVTNIQIEKGSTATPYVPYGYLPLK